jgi:hypothetical protein
MKLIHFGRWILTNRYNVALDERVVVVKESLDTSRYIPNRASEMLDFAKERFQEANDGFRSTSETANRLLGLCVITVGWFITRKESEIAWLASSGVFAMVVSVVILLLGNIGSESKNPCDFKDFAEASIENSTESESAETKAEVLNDWRYWLARQYAIATVETSVITSLMHKRLLAAVWFLIGGLLARWLAG